MSIGAEVGLKFIDKGIDQFNYGVSQEYQRYAREKARKWQVQNFPIHMQQAKEMGIHPLAALGSYSPQGPIATPAGGTPPMGGSGFSDAYRKGMERNQQKEVIAEQIKGLKLDNQAKSIEVQVKQRDLDNLDKPPEAGSPSILGGQQSSVDAANSFIQGEMMSSHANIKQGMKPLEEWRVDYDDNFYPVLEGQASESFENDLFAKVGLFKNKIKRHAYATSMFANVNTMAAYDWRNKMRRIRQSIVKSGKIPKGYQVSVTPFGGFKLEKSHGGFYSKSMLGKKRKLQGHIKY